MAIGSIKKVSNLTLQDAHREFELLQRITGLASRCKLDLNFVNKFYQHLMSHAVSKQKSSKVTMSLHSSIELLRNEIDTIDNQIITILTQRFEVTKQVGLYKALKNLPATDLTREAKQFAKFQKMAIRYKLDVDFVCQAFRIIIDQVVMSHKQIRLLYSS